jgi:hypothetical protein
MNIVVDCQLIPITMKVINFYLKSVCNKGELKLKEKKKDEDKRQNLELMVDILIF